ncbi:hypothetical protein ACEQ8H_008523 [Pleosporales sp. CAS-2024a]
MPAFESQAASCDAVDAEDQATFAEFVRCVADKDSCHEDVRAAFKTAHHRFYDAGPELNFRFCSVAYRLVEIQYDDLADFLEVL